MGLARSCASGCPRCQRGSVQPACPPKPSAAGAESAAPGPRDWETMTHPEREVPDARRHARHYGPRERLESPRGSWEHVAADRRQERGGTTQSERVWLRLPALDADALGRGPVPDRKVVGDDARARVGARAGARSDARRLSSGERYSVTTVAGAHVGSRRCRGCTEPAARSLQAQAAGRAFSALGDELVVRSRRRRRVAPNLAAPSMMMHSPIRLDPRSYTTSAGPTPPSRSISRTTLSGVCTYGTSAPGAMQPRAARQSAAASAGRRPFPPGRAGRSARPRQDSAPLAPTRWLCGRRDPAPRGTALWGTRVRRTIVGHAERPRPSAARRDP